MSGPLLNELRCWPVATSTAAALCLRSWKRKGRPTDCASHPTAAGPCIAGLPPTTGPSRSEMPGPVRSWGCAGRHPHPQAEVGERTDPVTVVGTACGRWRCPL